MILQGNTKHETCKYLVRYYKEESGSQPFILLDLSDKKMPIAYKRSKNKKKTHNWWKSKDVFIKSLQIRKAGINPLQSHLIVYIRQQNVPQRYTGYISFSYHMAWQQVLRPG